VLVVRHRSIPVPIRIFRGMQVLCNGLEAYRAHRGRPTVFAHACKMGLKGIVSKRKDSTYRQDAPVGQPLLRRVER
jgi:hypothetical protein